MYGWNAQQNFESNNWNDLGLTNQWSKSSYGNCTHIKCVKYQFDEFGFICFN